MRIIVVGTGPAGLAATRGLRDLIPKRFPLFGTESGILISINAGLEPSTSLCV